MMKKFYTLTLTGLMVAGISAQSLQKTEISNVPSHKVTNNDNYSVRTAVGDTLMYLPLPEFLINATDQAGFGYENNDQDGNAQSPLFTGGPWAAGTDWLLFFDDTPGNAAMTAFDIARPGTPDSSFYFGSTSWTDPATQVSDWLTFGPITIPATGATLHWRVRTPDQAFRDGYKVYVGGIGTAPTDFSASDVVFSKNDNTGNIGQDTVWTYRQVNVPAAYAGQQAYFGFENTATDMFILYMDEFLALEANNLGFDNNQFEGFALNQVMPNPATDVAYVNYALGANAEVTLMVTDINGKVVANINQGTKEMGTYNYPLTVSEFNSGVYFVTLKAGQFSSTKKLMVTK